MKKQLSMVLAVLMVGAVAFATMGASGFYMDYKQGLTGFTGAYVEDPTVITPPAWFELGWDFSMTETVNNPCPDYDACGQMQQWTDFAIEGNLFFANENIWSAPAKHIAGLDLEFRWLDWGFGVESQLNFASADETYWPAFIGLEAWTLEANIMRYFGSSFIAAGVQVNYDDAPGSGYWYLWPFIEVKLYW